jgi:hypothetical protein
MRRWLIRERMAWKLKPKLTSQKAKPCSKVQGFLLGGFG